MVRDFYPIVPSVKGMEKIKDLTSKTTKYHLIIAWFFGFYFHISDPNIGKAVKDKKMSSPSPNRKDYKEKVGDLPVYKLCLRPTYGPASGNLDFSHSVPFFIVSSYFIFINLSKNWIAQSTSLFHHSLSMSILPLYYNIYFMIVSSIFISHQIPIPCPFKNASINALF